MAATPSSSRTDLISSAPEPPEDLAQWHRVHWASPLVGGWVILVTLLVLVVKNLFQDLDFRRSEESLMDLLRGLAHLKLFGVGGLMLAAILGTFLFLFAQWYSTRFFITPTHVYLRQGVLFRSRSQVRLDRVQSLDIEQPLAARLLGLATLKLLTADGSGAENLSLSLIRTAQARALRHDLLTAVQEQSGPVPDGPASEEPGPDGSIPGDPAQTAPPPPQTSPLPAQGGAVVYRADPKRVMAGVLLSSGLVSSALLTGLLFGLARLPFPWVGELQLIASGLLGPLWIACAWSVGPSLLKQLGFAIHRREVGGRSSLAISQGLTSVKTSALQVDRIHALEVSQPLLWRPLGWRSLRYISAGGDSSGADELIAGTMLLPTASAQEIRAALPLLVPELALYAERFAEPASPDHRRPEHRTSEHASLGPSSSEGFRLAARNTWWMSPLSFRYSAVAYDGRVLLIRRGWLKRRMLIVPLRRTQGVSLWTSPLGRVLKAAQVQPRLVGSMPWEGTSVLLPEAEAHHLFERLRADAVAAAEAARLTGGRTA